MKKISNFDKIESLIVPNIIDLIIFLDKTVKSDTYTGRFIRGICFHLDIIGATPNLNSSGQIYHPFGTSTSANNCTASLQPVIVALQVR